MKKILYFITAMCLITSCCASEDSKILTTQPTNYRLHLSGCGTYGVYEFTYENHNYILIKGPEQVAMEHDPDCPCHYKF